MRIGRDDLRKFDRSVAPAPPPIEPFLSAVEEAAVIASDRTGDPVIDARRARVLVILRRAATPEGADAELIALLAAARALPLERRNDRLAAHQRLAGIGSLADPPPEVRRLLSELRIQPGDGASFAAALLGPGRDSTTPFGESDFGGNYPP